MTRRIALGLTLMFLFAAMGLGETPRAGAISLPGGHQHPGGTEPVTARAYGIRGLAGPPPGGHGRYPALQSGTIDTELQAEIEDCLRDQAGEYGVVIRDLSAGRTVLINADQPFLAASTYKLLVMYRVYQQLEYEELALNDYVAIYAGDTEQDGPYSWLGPGDSLSVAEAMEDMITASNNAAAFALARRVGGWHSVESAAAELGMTQTWLEDGYFWTTPSDMSAFFESLAAGQLLSAEASSSMTELLERQRLNDRIPALLPIEAIAAHKTGSLPGVINDAGIVFGPAGSFAISILTNEVNEGEAIELISQIALMAYDRYASAPEPVPTEPYAIT